ncbi:hypothetical protein NBT05_15565 [Aquimarina sp. ERC-38]|uniref:hypothetical protein n=1 Tax=Aquimarina sp. ERC-38 TaxID=2949996 RepID=UPI00224755F6|nr:hypothetical protein [Aquimarina sp. ERC-38]UZO80361.1 hypothetical protein NBT05_15565 [Aquimarina sp. ERC-38]
MKNLVITFIFLLATMITQACDICGCQLGGLYFGLLSNSNAHYLGVRYTKAHFNASIDYGEGSLLANEFSEDTFHRAELLGRYILSDRFQLHTIVPYIYNDMNGSEQVLTFQGFGDPSLLLYFNPLQKKEDPESKIAVPKYKNISHSLRIGGGIKLPVGKFNRLDKGEIVNRNFQVGTGSVDFLVTTNYSLAIKRWGINLEGSYKINTRNKDEYRFGNQFNASSYLFYAQPLINALLTPYSGIFYETGEVHKEGQIKQVNTGGNATHFTAGVQLNWKAITLNSFYQTPINQNYNTDDISTINAGERWSIGLLYNFKKKEKLTFN